MKTILSNFAYCLLWAMAFIAMTAGYDAATALVSTGFLRGTLIILCDAARILSAVFLIFASVETVISIYQYTPKRAERC